jgi:hypothetical protein
MEQRIVAALHWRSLLPVWNGWAPLNDRDLVESLSEHPQTERLTELSRLVCSSKLPKGGDWRAFLNSMWAAIQEFQELRDKYPLRYAPPIVSLECCARRCLWYTDSWDTLARDEVLKYAAKLQKNR